MLLAVTLWFVVLWTAESAVLDPALHLYPSPPVVNKVDRDDVTNLWTEQPRMERDADLSVLPIDQIKFIIHSTSPTTTEEEAVPSLTTKAKLDCRLHTASVDDKRTSPDSTREDIKDTPPTASTTSDDESMEKSETIWPMLRSTRPYFGIHVPLTFSLTGTYGRYGVPNVGVIGSSYASVSDTEGDGMFKLYGNYGKSGLAGSSYGSYGGLGGTRIYGNGGGGGAAWSGWGNGKWGHYGKG